MTPVVLGHVVYMGRWLASARRFVENADIGTAEPQIWTFSTGPGGDPPTPSAGSADLAGRLTVAAVHVPDRRLPGMAEVDSFATRTAEPIRAPDRDAAG